MIIGVPKEIKDNEYRVSVVPSGVKALVEAGHCVVVETGAGTGSGIADRDFIDAGAEMVATPNEIFSKAGLVIKVKEPLAVEYGLLREGQTLFTFLHLAAAPELTEALQRSGVTAVGYETIETKDGRLPILAPMSEVAGRLSVQIGAHYLMKSSGGEGVLLGGVPGVERGRVTIIGAGMVGINAAKTAVGLGAEVTVLDIDIEKFRHIEDIFDGGVTTSMSNSYNIEHAVRGCDMLIGAVHIPGARAPMIVTREMVSTMRQGSVVMDVSVDQGGCIETTRPTSHSEPVFEVDGVIHYGVTNMPGAVPRTSTFALTNATLPYLLALADSCSIAEAVQSDPSIAPGVNVHKGKVTNRALAESLDVEFTPLESIL